jgi:hypothetical protein
MICCQDGGVGLVLAYFVSPNKDQLSECVYIYIYNPIGNCEGKSFSFYDYFIIQLGVSKQTRTACEHDLHHT